jgi:pimeloyl-ACP methyl ester carboxylesterase
MYQVKRICRSEFVPIRNVNYHVRVWGQPNPDVPPLVLVHGWMDVAASYQFLVDSLSDAFFANRLIIAPDWRGYGLTTAAPVDNYWFADYMADLDFLLDHYGADFAAEQPVDLVGHSMGGNVVMMYAGVRPQRIRRLVNLEGYGVPPSRATSAPKRYATWMDELKALQKGDIRLKPYDSAEGVAQRLMKTNPRLARDEASRGRAAWLARHWAVENAAGQWEILGDPAHRVTGATLSRVDEVLALYATNTAPTLFVDAEENSLDKWHGGKFTQADFDERIKTVPNLTRARIMDAGHMLHHDQPEALARLIETFVA